MVGTFYAAPTPGAKSFVEIGDEINVGEVLCISEATKVMNEIEADRPARITGRVARIAHPVGYRLQVHPGEQERGRAGAGDRRDAR